MKNLAYVVKFSVDNWASYQELLIKHFIQVLSSPHKLFVVCTVIAYFLTCADIFFVDD